MIDKLESESKRCDRGNLFGPGKQNGEDNISDKTCEKHRHALNAIRYFERGKAIVCRRDTRPGMISIKRARLVVRLTMCSNDLGSDAWCESHSPTASYHSSFVIPSIPRI